MSKLEMNYQSIVKSGDIYRKNYIDGIEAYITRKKNDGYAERERFMPASALPRRLEEFRSKYVQMIGLDRLVDEECPESGITLIGEYEDCEIYRVVVYVTPEIPFSGILFKPLLLKTAPLIIAQHGGGGTPELCSDMNGKNNYNGMVRRLLKRNVSVFAPQLLLWNVSGRSETAPKHDIPYNRKSIDTALKQLGTSITALEIKGIMKSISYLSGFDFIEKDNIGMTGISYGGYFTLYTMAADKRIKAGYSNAAFNDRNKYNFSDWCYNNASKTFHDAEVAALCAPRKLYVSVGKQDEVLGYDTAVLEAERVGKFFEAFDCPENFVFDLWDGGHTMRPTDEGIDFLLSAFE